MEGMTLIGLLAATLTTIAFVPQAWQIIKSRKTDDLSLTMYILMFSGQLCWLAYGIWMQDAPLILANIIGCSLSGTILAFKLFLKQ
jgi:MtN3 and saliva related transmembrane protein